MTCKDCVCFDDNGCIALDTYIDPNTDVCHRYTENKYKKILIKLKKELEQDKNEFLK